MAKDSLAELENANYLARFDDGLLDLFIVVSLLWVGAAWMWFENLAVFAGILPAALATSFAAVRGRFLRNRGGYVRFSESRRDWERRNLAMSLGVGSVAAILVLLLGAAALATNPGAPLLLDGLVITGWAVVLISRYLGTHPRPDAS